ncbi:MAG: hypothetical protein JWS10_421 [Cypionkella sp.]|uniref:hypothetical protein n=1 Tax=Cypionkella sp. TaxID=2811411 RepID=UPI002619CB11|nr:hypothetical protein [Cypionkella sp.]MDB5657806.1 hypothetical protein [Cypionkella sp.]
MSKQPTLLFCVGATKAGTSWLYDHLFAHPECHFRTSLPGIARLSAHLGLTPMPADLDRRVHEGKAMALPEALRARALLWLRPQYEYVAAMFPALPEAWSRNMERGVA